MGARELEPVSVRDLRNKGGDILDRVARGQGVVVTRDGEQVAELLPLRRKSAAIGELIARRRALPRIDSASLRHDIDAHIDQTW